MFCGLRGVKSGTDRSVDGGTVKTMLPQFEKLKAFDRDFSTPL